MNWGPFEEKPKGSGISMTRVIAAMFAVTYCHSLLLVARASVPSTVMGWPFAALGIVIVLSIPIMALFKSLQSWLSTDPGKKFVTDLMTKVVSTAAGAATKMTTTVESGGKDSASPTAPMGQG